MSQKQEQYTKIITDEDNKKWFASLTEQEQTDLKLNTYRSFRNQKLQKTDDKVYSDYYKDQQPKRGRKP